MERPLEKVLQSGSEVQTELPCGLATPLLGLSPEETKAWSHRGARMEPLAPAQRQRWCPSADERSPTADVRLWDAVERGSAARRERRPAIVTTWVNLEGLVLSELSQRKTNTV